MRRAARLPTAVLVALALPGAAAARDVVALLPATGINVHEAHLAAAQDLLKGRLEQTGKYTVVVVPGPGGAVPEATPAEAVARAEKVGAELAVSLRVTRLGSSAVARITAHRVPSGEVVHADELPAASPDDLAPIVARLAQSMASGRPARSNAELDTVTEKENDPYAKVSATQTFGFRLGGLYAVDRAGTTGDGAVPGVGVYWLYDARAVLADVSIDLLNSRDNRFVAAGLGVYVPLLRSNVSPYLGGGVKYAWADFGGEGDSGLTVFGSAGLLMGRLFTMHVRAEVGWFVNTFGEREELAPEGTRDRHYTHGPALWVGLGF